MIGADVFAVDAWSIPERELHLDLLGQTESIFALSNGHIGLRGNLEEGEPSFTPGTFLNSFYACDLTFLLSVRLQSEFSLDGLADVVALCGPAVEGTGWPPGTGFAGFRRTGWAGGRRADVPEPPPDPGGGEPACSGRAFPGLAQILGQWPGQPELGMRGDDQPGPAVRCLRGAGLGAGPA